jgi:PHD/YefM family antitoxin component YafN of YafNO toxin-antitoxin module
MDRRIDTHIARTQFGQIMDLVTKNNERFVVDRRSEPAIVIMSVQEFIRIAVAPPDWLKQAWTGARRRGLDTLTPADIEAESTAQRRKQDPVTPSGVK